MKLSKGCWINWSNWTCAPHVKAQRCEHCQLVLFNYSNTDAEEFKNEWRAGLVFAFLIIVPVAAAMILLYKIVLVSGLPLNFPMLGILFGLLMILGIGLLLLLHACQYCNEHGK